MEGNCPVWPRPEQLFGKASKQVLSREPGAVCWIPDGPLLSCVASRKPLNLSGP